MKTSTSTSNQSAEQIILAMPENDYMNEKQVQFFSDRLTALRDHIIEATRNNSKSMSDNELVSDTIDRASAEEVRRNEQLVRTNEERQLSQVMKSLAKIRTKDFGYCDETGDQIGIARLLACPTATLTFDEQSRRERKTSRAYG